VTDLLTNVGVGFPSMYSVEVGDGPSPI
jgi:hypothetical protein